MSFAEAVKSCYLGRVSLSSTGFYATPKIHWDKQRSRGRPFFYFAYGAAVTEVARGSGPKASAVKAVKGVSDGGAKALSRSPVC